MQEIKRCLKNQTQILEQINHQARRCQEKTPGFAAAHNALTDAAYKTGALDAKTKRLMAMTAATVSGCRACILFQAEKALALGASVDEIFESIAVAVSLGGTMAEGHATRIIGYLEEKRLI